MKNFILLFLLSFLPIFLLNANNLEEIKQNQQIKIGVIDYSMLSGISATNQKFQIFEHELARQIAQKILGKKEAADLIIVNPDQTRVNEVAEGKVDILLAALSINENRKEALGLSLPYFFTNTAFLTKKGSEPIVLSNLKNKKLGVPEDSTAEVSLENLDFIKIKCDPEDCFKLLQDGEIDAYVDDDLTLYEYEARDPRYEISIKRVGKTIFFAIGVSKDNSTLLKAVDEALINLGRSGYLKNLYNEQLKPLHQTESSKFLLDSLYNPL